MENCARRNQKWGHRLTDFTQHIVNPHFSIPHELTTLSKYQCYHFITQIFFIKSVTSRTSFDWIATRHRGGTLKLIFKVPRTLNLGGTIFLLRTQTLEVLFWLYCQGIWCCCDRRWHCWTMFSGCSIATITRKFIFADFLRVKVG